MNVLLYYQFRSVGKTEFRTSSTEGVFLEYMGNGVEVDVHQSRVLMSEQFQQNVIIHVSLVRGLVVGAESNRYGHGFRSRRLRRGFPYAD
jgi:hypothetical protein